MNQRTVPQVARFGIFEADLRSHELRKRGVKVKLQEQPFQVLATLLEHPGEVVSREELRRRIWPSDTFVDFDNGLNGAVNRLREALGDSADSPRFVETLPRQGYRFLAAVEDATPVAGPGVLPKNGAGQAEAALPGKLANDGHRPARAKVLQPRAWGLAFLAVAGLALLASNLPTLRHGAPEVTVPPKIHSIAVLPLENLSGDPTQEYFADGMTEALTTDLGRIGGLGGLRVISRTSTMRYKGNPKRTVPEIAHELNVDAVVEGAALRSGNRVRITAQLIQAVPEKHLWAETYERDLQDTLTLQTDIARAIANEIQVKLTPQEEAHLLQAQPVDPQTYELYLRGRYFWEKRSLQKSIDYYQQAIQRQPRYALAYAAMAEAYAVSGADLSPKERCSKAKAAARTALQMDEGLAEAHAALALCLLPDWDWADAEKEFQRAIALNPNYAMAHQWYGFLFLRAMGRENAGAEMKRAHELEPLSLIFGYGGYEGDQRPGNQDDQMIEDSLKKLELDPNLMGPYVVLGMSYTRKGMYQEAVVQLQKGLSLFGERPVYLSTLGYIYAVSGNRAQALKTVKRLVQLSKRRYVSPWLIARVYVALGEKDLAFDWLEKAFADRSIPIDLKVNKELETLRPDPRFQDLVRRMGLPS